MPETPRYTRSWPWGITKWSTSYRSAPVNWAFIRVLDWAPMFVVGVFFMDTSLFGPLLAGSLVWCAARLVYRRERRSRVCARRGHDPYRPIPELADYRCRYCDSWLDPDEIVDQAREPARQRARAIKQSYYSNRR